MNAQRVTYGDFLTLPSVPGVLWRVIDLRELASAGSDDETRAELRPFHPGPDAANPAEGARAYGYDEPLQVGRAKRHGVHIALAPERTYDGDPHHGGRPNGWKLSTRARTRAYSATLTDNQRDILEIEAGDPFAFAYYLPPLSDEEIRDRLRKTLTDEYVAQSAARDTISSAPKFYNMHNGEAATIRAAFDSPAGAETLAAILDQATARYRDALAAELRTFGALPTEGNR